MILSADPAEPQWRLTIVSGIQPKESAHGKNDRLRERQPAGRECPGSVREAPVPAPLFPAARQPNSENRLGGLEEL